MKFKLIKIEVTLTEAIYSFEQVRPSRADVHVNLGMISAETSSIQLRIAIEDYPFSYKIGKEYTLKLEPAA